MKKGSAASSLSKGQNLPCKTSFKYIFSSYGNVCVLIKLRIYKLFHYKLIFELLCLLSTEIIHLKLKQPGLFVWGLSSKEFFFHREQSSWTKKNITSVGMAGWVSPFYFTILYISKPHILFFFYKDDILPPNNMK